MQQIMKKPELVDALAEKTGFYKKNMKDVVDALEEIIVDNFKAATYDSPSELHLATGIVIGGRRVPEHESIDPRDRSVVMTPEKVIPYAEFKPSIRKKLYVKPKGCQKKKKEK